MGKKYVASTLEPISEDQEDQVEDYIPKKKISLDEIQDHTFNVEHMQNSFTSSDSNSSEAYQTENIINYDNLINQLEPLDYNIIAPIHSAHESLACDSINLSKIHSYQSSESSIADLNENVSTKTIDFGENVLEKYFTEEYCIKYIVKKSPKKKQDPETAFMTIKEINKIESLELEEQMKISKLNLEIHNFERAKQAQVERRFFYIKEIKNIGEKIDQEKVDVHFIVKEYEQKNIEALEDKRLLEQHMMTTKMYFARKIENLKMHEESCRMEIEDLRHRFLSLRASNVMLKKQQKIIKKNIETLPKLVENRGKNETLIQEFSLMLQGVAKYIEESENWRKVGYTEKIMNLVKDVQMLEESANEFSQDALQDPRKLIPYMRSATPSRQNTKTSIGYV
ncbi:hypothetical protein SteCoe_17347 [Stentor coeruleus]|uniref:Uncharacterized protein n=1 Tax=Stentor coeruleus TaxID=5963 RepID=A0A1R2BZ77_9CILI|nr:hypothetical protein SteCoe_17347 [Stentor coeruleus]